MLTVEDIDQAVESYIVWRGQVGSTEHERVVKKAIIDTPVKRTKLRTLLRRILLPLPVWCLSCLPPS